MGTAALPFAGCGIIDPFGKALALTDCYSKIVMTTVYLLINMHFSLDNSILQCIMDLCMLEILI